MKKKGLVSVAMTTYNGESYLKEQLESVIKQTYSNIKLVIVDDCSTDSTMLILELFKRKYKDKIQVFSNAYNLGLVKNFEKALSFCHGEYVAFCDQDDIWEYNKIERLLAEIGRSSLIYSDASLIDKNGVLMVASRTKKYCIDNRSGIGFNDLLFKNYVVGCTSLFRRSLLVDVLPIPEQAMFHDWWVAIVASKKEGIKYLDESLVKYRQHDNNVYGQRQGGILQHLKLILFRDSKKIEDYKRRLIRLENMEQHYIFTELDRYEIGKAKNFYRTYIGKSSLFYHWLALAKHYPRITTKRHFFKLLCR